MITNNNKKKENNNLLKSVIDNDYSLSNQLISLLTIVNEILFLLTDIFRAKIFLLPKTFHDLKEKKDLLELPNIL